MNPRGGFVLLAGRVVTCDPARASNSNPLGTLTDAGVLVEGATIRMVGSRADIANAAGRAPVLIDAPAAVLTPGLCDAHTHSAFVGSRHDEYARRMAGVPYDDIARAGGGIVASMRAVRAATRGELARSLQDRLARMAALGVTTVEVKSGYGLDDEGERKQLEAIAEARQNTSLPRVVATYLALHALPAESVARRAAYVAEGAARVRTFAAEGLVDFVDAYVDANAFSTSEAELVAAAARASGIGVRLHAGQFADVGAAALAARVGAASADHLEHVTRRDLDALAAAGTRAVLLPVASFTLGERSPPVSDMRAAGVRIVVASDANPGTAPTESLPLALAFAVRSYALTPEEALLGATREAAHALGLGDRVGTLSPGLDADLTLWDLPHEQAIVQPWGTPRTLLVISRGQTITPAQPAPSV
jgi:imidazolonepropionase